jgi:hypothetical protein
MLQRSALLLLICTLPQCIISGDKCGPHQVLIEDYHSICVCEAGYVISDDGLRCNKCGKNEEAANDMCVCKSGYQRPSAGMACTRSELGSACSESQPCTDAFPFCAPAADDEGYCTLKDCAEPSDCPEGWSCENQSGTRFCRRPPSGFGESCETSRDCGDFEASYCEAFQSRTCMLEGCATGGVKCPSGWSCCDYSLLLGSALSLCVTPDGLDNGACPQGGSLATP